MRIHAVIVCILLSAAHGQVQAHTSLNLPLDLNDVMEMNLARTEASRLAALDAQAVVTQAESIRAGHLPTVDPVVVLRGSATLDIRGPGLFGDCAEAHVVAMTASVTHIHQRNASSIFSWDGTVRGQMAMKGCEGRMVSFAFDFTLTLPKPIPRQDGQRHVLLVRKYEAHDLQLKTGNPP